MRPVGPRRLGRLVHDPMSERRRIPQRRSIRQLGNTGQSDVRRSRDTGGEHNESDARPKWRATLRILGRVGLLALEQREHVTADVGLRRIGFSEVAAEPRQRERLPSRSAHQHARDGEPEQRGESLEANVVVERSLTGGGAQVAVHLLSSPQGQNGALGVLLAAAGSALTQGAPQVGATYLRRALDETVEGEERARILIDLGRAEARIGGPGAIEHLEAGLRLARVPERRVDAAIALAHTLAAGERAAESVTLLTELGDDLTDTDPGLASRVFSELVSLGDLIARPLVPPRARRLARSSDPAGLTHRAVELTASAASAAEAGRLAQLRC
jgi:hypothetical protein